MSDIDEMEDRISAGELRAAGIAIIDRIPDCATVPRTAMRTQICGIEVTDIDRTLKATAEISFCEPFRWFEISVHLDSRTCLSCGAKTDSDGQLPCGH